MPLRLRQREPGRLDVELIIRDYSIVPDGDAQTGESPSSSLSLTSHDYVVMPVPDTIPGTKSFWLVCDAETLRSKLSKATIG